MNATQNDARARRLIGIDLGTTNSALAWTAGRTPVTVFEIPQAAAGGEVRRFPTLPSFLYFPTEAERQSRTLSLPWDSAPASVAGVFARDHGALVPSRQVASAKSWLAHGAVDRTAALLPWGVDAEIRISPVEASARLLTHLRDAWNHVEGATDTERALERQAIVLTVPASFDEEARELTVQAAREAGFERIVLLEEPIAALYAWIASHRQDLSAHVSSGSLILVCDVGGGTTDFSLIRVSAANGASGAAAIGQLEFERIAIGEHLLLGGDNLDLALAALVEHKLTGSGSQRLTLAQRQTLRRKCAAAKEELLSDGHPDSVRITILGAGRGVVGGGMTTDLTRAEVVDALTTGFLPLTALDDLPARDRRSGLREIGLPFEPEPAITRHLAAFLTRADQDGSSGTLRPDAVLFNGGFFTPALARERVLAVLASWFGSRPSELANERPEAAVAVGAAFYARLRENPTAARHLLVRAGSARSYYVVVDDAAATETRAVCVLARGTQEGTAISIDRTFDVTTNQPASFRLVSSLDRTDSPGDIVTLPGADAHEHAPLITILRYGKRSRRVPIAVGLHVVFTETGTLELWCEARETGHRWRLAFNLRAVEADPLDMPPDDNITVRDEGVVPREALTAASRLIERTFGDDAVPLAPDALIGEIENALGFGKQAWPASAIRPLADALLRVENGRVRSAAHEVRWLNLTGFCVRPGFGSTLDEWRISELRKVYAAGLAFPREVQNQVEWLVLWQRVCGGFSSGHQRELAQRVAAQLGHGQKKAPRINPQIEREGWRLLASLERLDANLRANLGDALAERIRKDARNRSLVWALGRFGARAPVAGPLSAVVTAAVAERWVDGLLAKTPAADAAEAITRIGALTGDPGRDLPESVRLAIRDRLTASGIDAEQLRPLVEVVPAEERDTSLTFGEALPAGLRLQS